VSADWRLAERRRFDGRLRALKVEFQTLAATRRLIN